MVMAESEPETIRLHQANERTMLAWVRTGIALMAFGFAISRFDVFLRQLAAAGSHPVPGARGLEPGWVGVALVAVGMLANLTATLRFSETRRAIARGHLGAPSAVAVYVLGGGATAIGLAMAILLARALAG